MPTSLGSLSGVDPAVARGLNQLATAVNHLEGLVGTVRASGGQPADVQALTQRLALAEQQIQSLLGQVATLQAAVAALTP